jgi:hypothetical protein
VCGELSGRTDVNHAIWARASRCLICSSIMADTFPLHWIAPLAEGDGRAADRAGSGNPVEPGARAAALWACSGRPDRWWANCWIPSRQAAHVSPVRWWRRR